MTSLKIEKKKDWSNFKVSLKEIYGNMVQMLSEDSSSNETVKKWPAEFIWCMNSTEGAPQSGYQKTSTTNVQIDAILHMVLNKSHLTV